MMTHYSPVTFLHKSTVNFRYVKPRICETSAVINSFLIPSLSFSSVFSKNTFDM